MSTNAELKRIIGLVEHWRQNDDPVIELLQNLTSSLERLRAKRAAKRLPCVYRHVVRGESVECGLLKRDHDPGDQRDHIYVAPTEPAANTESDDPWCGHRESGNYCAWRQSEHGAEKPIQMHNFTPRVTEPDPTTRCDCFMGRRGLDDHEWRCLIRRNDHGSERHAFVEPTPARPAARGPSSPPRAR